MQVGKKNKVKKAMAKNVEEDSVSSGTEPATIQPDVHEKDMILLKSYNQMAVMRSAQANREHQDLQRR